MGTKIKPHFIFDENEFDEFEKGVQDTSYDKAVSIAWKSKDGSGHSQVVSFRCVPFYGRLAAEIQAKEPRFKTPSDVFRTSTNLGMKQILNALKGENKIGDELDDLHYTIDHLEKEMKADDAFVRWEAVLKKIPKSLSIYRSDPEVFKSKVKAYEKEIEGIESPFWRERLSRRFRKMLKSMDDSCFGNGDSCDEEDL